MLDISLFSHNYSKYIGSFLFTYENSAIRQQISTDIYNFDKKGIASLKPQYEFVGYCDSRDLAVRPSNDYYTVMLIDNEDNTHFWLHVHPDIFNDVFLPEIKHEKIDFSLNFSKDKKDFCVLLAGEDIDEILERIPKLKIQYKDGSSEEKPFTFDYISLYFENKKIRKIILEFKE